MLAAFFECFFNAQTQEEKKVEYNPLLLPHPPHHPELRGGNAMRGKEGGERAGAKRVSLALRCPANTTQPDDPGSGWSQGRRMSQKRSLGGCGLLPAAWMFSQFCGGRRRCSVACRRSRRS